MPGELSACKAVMGTTGMSLLPEAVWLKKPFFGIPLKNEFEQRWNATQIRQAHFGDFAEEPTPEAVDHFFRHLDDYRRSLEAYRFDADAAGQKLLEVIEQSKGQEREAAGRARPSGPDAPVRRRGAVPGSECRVLGSVSLFYRRPQREQRE